MISSNYNNKYIWKKKTFVSYCLSILVFWIHCSSFDNYRPFSTEIDFISYLFQRTVTPVAVPLFMVISGALFFRDYSNTNYVEKVKRRIKTLLIPFLLWNTINMAFNIVATAFFRDYFIGREPFELTLKNIVEGIFHYKYNMPFWFVFALIVFAVCAPLINYLIYNKAIGIVAILLLWIASIFNIGLPEPLFFNKTCIIYYLTGAFIGKFAFDFFSKKTEPKRQLVCLFWLLVIWAYRITIFFNIIQENHMFEVPLLIIESLCVWSCFDFICNRINIHPFMNNSFWVFALHVNMGAIITKLIYIVFSKQPYLSIVNFILTTIITLTIIEVIAVITKRIAPTVYKMLSGERGSK